MDKDSTTYIQELDNGKYRLCTDEEIKIALEFHNELEEARKKVYELETLVKNCSHPVCYDVPGYIYDNRVCLICGYVYYL